MTRQEEIREGIESRVTSLMVLCGEPRQKARKDAKELVGAWFKWMDSQGVVIKKEDQTIWFLEATEAYKKGQKDMLKAGYIAWVPLIEGETNG